MNQALELFFRGYEPRFVRREYTANFLKNAARKAERTLVEYRGMRAQWWNAVRDFGRDSYEAQVSDPYQLRIRWRSDVRWYVEAPRGGRYCNLSPAAQRRINSGRG
jgi:hypothetical protein